MKNRNLVLSVLSLTLLALLIVNLSGLVSAKVYAESQSAAESKSSAGPVTDIPYTCHQAVIKGYTLDPSVLGGEYTVVFHSDGSAVLTLAGAALPDLKWNVEGETVLLKDDQSAPLRLLPEGEGYKMEYANAVKLFFVQ